METENSHYDREFARKNDLPEPTPTFEFFTVDGHRLEVEANSRAEALAIIKGFDLRD